MTCEISQQDASVYAVRVVVAGSRHYNDYEAFKWVLKGYLSEFEKADVVIITGRARLGPDNMVVRYCEEHKLPYTSYFADWDTHKKAAGYKRNLQMCEASTHVLVFWDLMSKGSRHMLDIAKRANRHTSAVLVHPDEVVQDRALVYLNANRFMKDTHAW